MRAAVWLRARLLARVVDLDDETAGRLGAGQLIARATGDVDTIDNWVRGLATLVTATFTLLAVTAALLGLGPVLALVGLATVPLAALLAIRRVGAQRRAAAAMAEATGGYTGAVEETVTGTATMHGIGGELVMARRAGAASAALRAAALRRERVEASWLSTSMLVPGLGIAVGVWLGGEQVLAGTLSPGSLLAFVGWMALLVDAVQTLTERLIDRGQARAAADRLVPVLTATGVAEPPDPVPLPPGAAVSFESVTVERDGRTVVVGVDLDVAAGEWVALVGPSGAGKSSLLRLLPRLLDPSAGTVRVAGVDVARVELDALRARVGFLGHGGVLLSGTVRENLVLAAPGAVDGELWAALDAAAATEVVTGLPGGLDGSVGTGGATLSGGQRSRLALARTLLARPPVLVLDDVTSALDPATESAVLAGVRRFAPDTTVLCATHRLATVLAADRVVVLGHGRVRQIGPPAEVLADGGAGAAVLDLDAVGAS